VKWVRIVFSLIVMAGPLAVFGADSYTIDPRHTFPHYEIDHHGFSLQRGRFERTRGKITLDRSARTGTVEVVVDTASVTSGVSKLDEHLMNEDFFNVQKYPQMTFRASKIVFSGEVPAAIPGEFTLLGVTKPVTFTVTRFNCGVSPVSKKEVCGADATAMIKRTEFGMTKYAPAIGDEVKLILNVEATKD
jgi:polyisoprenoid-binding protein YceI